MRLAHQQPKRDQPRDCDFQGGSQSLRVREEIAFSSERKWSVLVIEEDPDQGIYVLGAPEMLLPGLCPATNLGSFIEWGYRDKMTGEIVNDLTTSPRVSYLILVFPEEPNLTPEI